MLTRLGEDDIVSVTPYRDQNGRRIMIYKFGNWRPSKIPVDDIFRASLILFEVGALEPQSQVLGGVGEYCGEKLHIFLKFVIFSVLQKKKNENKNVYNVLMLFLHNICLGIFDLEGLALQHVWNLTPSVAKKIISLMVVCELYSLFFFIFFHHDIK